MLIWLTALYNWIMAMWLLALLINLVAHRNDDIFHFLGWLSYLKRKMKKYFSLFVVNFL